MSISNDFTVPSEKEYIKALKKIRKQISDTQKKLLEHHLKSNYQAATFVELAGAVNTEEYQKIIDEYSALGKLLGDTVNMGYLESVSSPGEPFYCSALGGGNPYRNEDEHYQLVMYRELAGALHKLKWFK